MNVPHLYISEFTSEFISLYSGFTTDATSLKGFTIMRPIIVLLVYDRLDA
jgi:hypothetical protein